MCSGVVRAIDDWGGSWVCCPFKSPSSLLPKIEVVAKGKKNVFPGVYILNSLATPLGVIFLVDWTEAVSVIMVLAGFRSLTSRIVSASTRIDLCELYTVRCCSGFLKTAVTTAQVMFNNRRSQNMITELDDRIQANVSTKAFTSEEKTRIFT